MLAELDLLESAPLVAVTVTVRGTPMEAGAVYRPAVEIEPASDGLIDQFTAVLVLPVTDALNCCVCDADNAPVNGLTLTLTGTR